MPLFTLQQDPTVQHEVVQLFFRGEASWNLLCRRARGSGGFPGEPSSAAGNQRSPATQEWGEKLYLVIPWMRTIMHGVPAWIVSCSVAWHIRYFINTWTTFISVWMRFNLLLLERLFFFSVSGTFLFFSVVLCLKCVLQQRMCGCGNLAFVPYPADYMHYIWLKHCTVRFLNILCTEGISGN